MRVAITNCTELMNWRATVGEQSKLFTFPGKSYGPESTAAMNEALDWVQTTVAGLRNDA